MSDPFIGEIRMFACSWAPRDWALCNGQLLGIAQFAALFSVIGSNFGGDAVRTFALPDLEGNVPVGTGTGAGLSSYVIGQFGGSQSVTLQHGNNPAHNHLLQASGINATDVNPAGKIYAKGRYTNPDNSNGVVQLYGTAAPAVQQS